MGRQTGSKKDEKAVKKGAKIKASIKKGNKLP